MNLLKLAEEDIRSCAADGTSTKLFSKEAKAIADELDRLRSIIAKDERGTGPLRREIEALRAELAALNGEAERTVYVQADFPNIALDIAEMGDGFERRTDAEHPAGSTVYAVRMSARKVQP